MVFQSAMNALNPVMRVGDQFVDMMRAHERDRKRARSRAPASCWSSSASTRAGVRAYPHELSGGMRQRVVIAMALALGPELVDHGRADDGARRRRAARDPPADRRRCKRDFGFAVLFITHDLSLLLEFADRIAIMYAGEIVETAPAAQLAHEPLHPYTRGCCVVPAADGAAARGSPGSPARRPTSRDPPAGCRFHPRCPHCRADGPTLYRRQTTERPRLREVEPGHRGRLPPRRRRRR